MWGGIATVFHAGLQSTRIAAAYIGRGGSLGAVATSTKKQNMPVSMRPQPSDCMCVLSRKPWRSCTCTTPTASRQHGTQAQ